MDSDGILFQGTIDLARPSIPLRRPAVMPAQSLETWTPLSLAAACVNWLTAETPLRPLARATAPINRRA